MTRRINLDFLDELMERCEERVAGAQEDLIQAATKLAVVVGPTAAAHRLAELAKEFDQISKDRPS
jgi:hypothetical protein